MSSRFVGASIVIVWAMSHVLCAQTLLNFESLSDGEAVTTQFSGVTFSNVRTLTAGFSLDDPRISRAFRQQRNIGCRGTDHSHIFRSDNGFFRVFYSFESNYGRSVRQRRKSARHRIFI